MQTLRSDTQEDQGLPYSVNLWGSDPHAGNDDCNTGGDYATRDEAMAVFENPWSDFHPTFSECTAVIEVSGPDVYETRPNPDHVPSTGDDDSDWLEEMARQNGMAFGCAGYNDTYGY